MTDAERAETVEALCDLLTPEREDMRIAADKIRKAALDATAHLPHHARWAALLAAASFIHQDGENLMGSFMGSGTPH